MLRRAYGSALLLIVVASCSFDSTDPAPFVGPPTAQGECGTTESLFPKLLAFVRADKFSGLKQVIDARLVPTDADPMPALSLRQLVGDVVRLISHLGLDRTQLVVDYVRKGDFESQVAPLLSTVLKFIDGRLDGHTHFESGDAVAVFLRRCDPDHLLLAVESLLRFKSASHAGVPWLLALVTEVQPLLADPRLNMFLDTFQANAQKGRPAVVAILGQIMVQIADENFSIQRVETLLESAVYPAVSQQMRSEIEPLVSLLDEATRPEAGILAPLQQAVRCGLEHPMEKDQLLGLVYDLIASQDVDLGQVISALLAVLKPDLAEAELNLFGDVVKVVRTDLSIRDDLREALAIFLSTPNSQLTVPVLIDLLDEGVLSELFEALAKLLSGCGRA